MFNFRKFDLYKLTLSASQSVLFQLESGVKMAAEMNCLGGTCDCCRDDVTLYDTNVLFWQVIENGKGVPHVIYQSEELLTEETDFSDPVLLTSLVSHVSQNETTAIVALGEFNATGVQTNYQCWGEGGTVLADIRFQSGPQTEVNGITMEALLEICKHRLEAFQRGPYPHECNQAAIDHIQQALNALSIRKKSLGAVVKGVSEVIDVLEEAEQQPDNQ